MLDLTDRVATLEKCLAVLEAELHQLQDEWTVLKPIPQQVATLAIHQEECAEDTRWLRQHLEQRRAEREREQSERITRMRNERVEAARERKLNHRWMIGTGLTSSSLVIAAVAILADKF